MSESDALQIWVTSGTYKLLGDRVSLKLSDGETVEFVRVGEIPDEEDSDPRFVEVTNADSEGREFLALD
jgi:hypothetical protein